MSASLFVLAVAASQLLFGVNADLIRKESSPIVMSDAAKHQNLNKIQRQSKMKHFQSMILSEATDGTAVTVKEASSSVAMTGGMKKDSIDLLQDAITGAWVNYDFYASNTCSGDIIAQQCYLADVCLSALSMMFSCTGNIYRTDLYFLSILMLILYVNRWNCHCYNL